MSKTFIIAIVIILVILILGGYFFWWPKYQEFGEKKLELIGKDEAIRQKEKHLAGLNALSEKLTGYEDELGKIDAALPIEPSMPALFNFILETSAQNGLILDNIDLGVISSRTEERVQKIPF